MTSQNRTQFHNMSYGSVAMIYPTKTMLQRDRIVCRDSTYFVLAVTITSRWTACHFDRFQRAQVLLEEVGGELPTFKDG